MRVFSYIYKKLYIKNVLKAMKLFLIDAYALIYRAYYAFLKNPRINSKGMNTSAIFGFINSLEDVLKREQPTHVAVAFDPHGPTFRHEAFEQYKAQREETPEVIRQSVPVIKEIIQAYRIPILEVPYYEADDVIGTIAHQAASEGFDVYMMTPDKDYGQLVGEHIYMYRPKFGGDYEVLGVAEVLEKYQLTSTSQVIDLLGLMGDTADNIPSPRPYRPAQRGAKEKDRRECRADPLLQIPRDHQDRRAHYLRCRPMPPREAGRGAAHRYLHKFRIPYIREQTPERVLAYSGREPAPV